MLPARFAERLADCQGVPRGRERDVLAVAQRGSQSTPRSRDRFLTGLTDGSLPAECFAYFLAQHAHYLRDYAATLAAVGAKAPRMPTDAAMFARLELVDTVEHIRITHGHTVAGGAFIGSVFALTSASLRKCLRVRSPASVVQWLVE